MFAKAFRVKSNTAVKGSDRRKLRADVAAAFPAFGPEQLSELVPGKDELNIVKLYAHKGDAVTVYVSGGNPVLFELKGTLYPTVYTLWSYPDLLPAFTTWPPVLEKLVGGADLMLPGLTMPPGGLPQVQQGDLCAITLVGNRAPVAIGVATMSTAEMLASGLKGRGFTVLHTYLDHLCNVWWCSVCLQHTLFLAGTSMATSSAQLWLSSFGYSKENLQIPFPPQMPWNCLLTFQSVLICLFISLCCENVVFFPGQLSRLQLDLHQQVLSVT